jgi:hypothetical protein
MELFLQASEGNYKELISFLRRWISDSSFRIAPLTKAS